MARLILAGSLLLVLAACSGGAATSGAPAGNSTPTVLVVTSPAFAANAPIPEKYSCKGENISPPLQWTEPPVGTKSIALIVDDPDAPSGDFVHWVVYNLPSTQRELAEGASSGAGTSTLPQGTQQGKNGANQAGYTGPCPPSGQHHYLFHLYALDTTLSGTSLNKAALLKAMDGHLVGAGLLTGVFQK